ncbi:pirin-like C-terminal cupin domain-containing protein [Hymenobacter convexus]|uniref:pirin-like C-terminal cupin domain-containing protein n=1 Tax=Hymenobacter sp. CA1UV-4 TaxID=3063782 RepID=UPI00271387DD|nr:pirin-like C-terminal cupin domain-containing protein [Hymenobacter sp. CA1UV-4]MDO7851238.1 pirin-like C-terminal cupin domain-containing protein [Hymenobacter sp. CA1UV-4]
MIDGNRKAVGDGFQVTSPMPGPRIRQLSPFLLIDHIGPMTIAPSDKPLTTYGPFVMNTNNELVQAIADFESGAMGKFEDEE